MLGGVVGVDKEEVYWTVLCDLSNKFGTAGVALNEFDVIEYKKSFSGISTDLDVDGEDLAGGSSGKV